MTFRYVWISKSVLHIAAVAGNVKTFKIMNVLHKIKNKIMTNLEKTKTQISSIFDEYKKAFYTNEELTPRVNVIDTSSILITPSGIKSDMIFKMNEIKYNHVERYGNEHELEINNFIQSYDQSFSQFLESIF